MPTEKTLFVCRPGNDFPSISVTGDRCDLMCEHCLGKHLKGMKSPSEGMSAAKTGMLLSGGCDADGAVPVHSYIDMAEELSSRGLPINVHTGFSSDRDIADFGRLNVVFSVDVHQDPGVISSILHLDRKPEDYSKLLDTMIATGKKVIPHITVGFGTDDLYLSAKLIQSKGLKKVVLLSMVPTEGTIVEDVAISEDAILKAVDIMTEMGLEISLGCMRDRRLRMLERRCIEKGVKRIANPSNETVQWAKDNGCLIIEEPLCCSVTF